MFTTIIVIQTNIGGTIAQAVERAENVAGVNVQHVTVATAGGMLRINNYAYDEFIISAPILDNGGSGLIVSGPGTTILALFYDAADAIATFLPALAAGGGWPDAVRKDVAGQAARFMASLVETSHQIRGKTVLYIPPDSLPTDIKAAAQDKDLLQRLEATVIHWTRQVKEVA